MADGGVVEGALLSEALASGAAAEGGTMALGSGGGFGALNLAGNSATMVNPIAASLGGGSYFSPLAGLSGGAGLTSLGELGTAVSPYAGIIPEYGINSAFPLAEGASAASTVPGGELSYAAPPDGVQYNTPAASPAVPPAPSSDMEMPKWLKSMYTDSKTGEFSPIKAGAYGLGGMTLFNLLTGRGNNYLTPYQPKTAASYGLNRQMASNYRPIRMADGGIASLNIGPSSVASRGVAPADLLQQNQNQGVTMSDLQNLAQQYGYSLPSMAAGGLAMGGQPNQMYPQSQQEHTNFATPSQMPTSAQAVMSDYDTLTSPFTGQERPMNMARGGIADLGGYSDGGRMLRGPGDGMSDSIPASISGKQPARLADGEFVVPADVVSHLGNGSTDAGAKQLYSMMNKVRKARTGNPKQGKQINAKKYIPE